MRSWLRSASGFQLATAGGLLLLALATPVAAQNRKKNHTPQPPKSVQIVSEASAPETAKPVVVSPEASARTEGAYRTSLKDLVKLRETELSAAESQRAKLEELVRDGLVSRRSVEEADGAVVEARARLEDARVRLVSIDGNPVETADTDEDLASNPESNAKPAAAEPKPVLKKTSIIYPRRKAAAKKKTH